MDSFSYLAAAAGTLDAQLRSAPVAVKGFSASETAGSAAYVVLRDGTSASDPGVIFIHLTANESSTFEFENERGMQFTRGVFLDRVSGTTEVAVWV